MSKFRIGGSPFSRFMNGKGFYIALALCLVAIGSAAYVAVNKSVGLLSGTTAKSGSSYSVSSYSWGSNSAEQTGKTVSGVPDSRKSSASATRSTSLASGSSSAISSETSSGASSGTSSQKSGYYDAKGNKLIFVLPCNGTVIGSFSNGSLVYNKTLEDYRVHNGIDISAAAGTPVKSTADGTVKSVSSNFELGEQVMVDHGNGLYSIYGNLSTAVTVKKGQKVEAGDTLGCVGKTAQSELALPSHLHFALMKDEKYIDPLSVLSSK